MYLNRDNCIVFYCIVLEVDVKLLSTAHDLFIFQSIDLLTNQSVSQSVSQSVRQSVSQLL